MNIKSLIFCICTLAATFLVARIAFTAAALPLDVVQASRTPQSPELFDDVEIPDFGAVPVLDMIDYYIENPPIVVDSDNSAAKKVRFQGC